MRSDLTPVTSSAALEVRPSWLRRWVALPAAVAAAMGLVGVPTAAYGSTVVSATFANSAGAGIAVVGSTVYAKSGASLTLTVTTSADTKCVVISGAHSASQAVTGNVGTSSWSFAFSGPTDSGTKTVTVTPSSQKNCTVNPNGQNADVPLNASYEADNTAPAVTAALNPIPNGAGWNKANVTVTWTASDGTGSGVAGGPTPATDSVTANTTGETKTATATDRVGNTGNGSVTVKLDKANPTITGSRTPAANANGWNNTDVSVVFSCADSGPSGIKSCPSSTTLTNTGASQAVSGTALDNADNSASVTVSQINIDKVAPTLTGSPTTAANGNGWYNGNVTVAWTANDLLSGVVATPAGSTIASEGSGLTASATVLDKAGNSTTASSSPAVDIDRTAPLTTAGAPPAWNNTDVTVSLNANDTLSGVASTSYTLDGGATQTGTSVPVTTEGTHVVSYWSTDRAGNVEATRTVQVKIDKTSPTISHSQSPAANGNGWNKAGVTVTFLCADALSGIASCTSPQTVSSQGANQAVTGTGTDNAGNTATDPARVSIDTTAPTVALTADRAANGYGWYAGDVIVTAGCSDALSGIDSCSGPTTLGEGADQTATGTATDAAGNTASAARTGINVDKTAPTVSGATTTIPNSDGWYAGDVTVAWTCGDALSGLAAACPATTTITGEGSNLGASRSATDKAGNVAAGSVDGLQIDRTAPVTIAEGVPAGGGWQQNPVTLTFSVVDGLSGRDVTYVQVDGGAVTARTGVTLGDGDHTVRYWSVDKAGNIETSSSIVVRVDTLLPTISSSQSPAANPAGWNNTPVTVSFACADQVLLSGIAGCTPASRLFADEGKGQAQVGTATDRAGNVQTTTATVDLDLTAPTATAAADRPANARGWYRDPVTVTSTCSDVLSGIDVCPPARTFDEGTGQGYAGSATDVAGNTTPVSLGGINVDRTAPTLSAAPTAAPNGYGWFKAPVTFEWTCEDSGGSGLDGDCPETATIADEGVGQRVSADVRDVAGNATHGVSDGVRIDTTAPVTEAGSPTGWTNVDVRVTLTAADNLSGVAETHYTVDGGAELTGTGIDLPDEGVHEVSFWSVDKAGNAETPRTATIKIDKTAPRITSAQDPVANANGWNNTSVTVTFTCTDELSSIRSCVGDTTLTGEGRNQAVTGTATDNANNTAQATQTVSIDRTPPTITASRSPAANEAGWNRTTVTVGFGCDDTLSQVTSCPGDVIVTDVTDRSVTGTAVDGAGNTASAGVEHLNVDTVDPTISGVTTADPNSAGWYRGDVVVGWTCDDERSGVSACPSDSTITGEGDALTASAVATDRAGNTRGATSPAVKIDRTAPTTEIIAASVWRNAPIAVSLTSQDGLSGVTATHHTVDGGAPTTGAAFTVSGNGVHPITFWSVDAAGNVEATHTATVRIDLTDPTITHTVTPAPNAAGWNRTVPVSVAFDCADQPGLSGIADCGPTPQAFTADGGDQVASATAMDTAGNTASDAARVKIDTAPPSISASADRTPDNGGWYDHDVTVSFDCADSLSGISSCPAPRVLGEGANQSAAGTASDLAGNTAGDGVSGIDVDTTKPTLSGAPSTTPDGSNGWYRSPVRIRWTAADNLSGIDSTTRPGDTVLDEDGVGQTVTADVKDLAGNRTVSTTAPVKIDQNAPVTRVMAPTDWVNDTVTVTLAASDATSGVADTRYRLDGGPAQSGTSAPITAEGVHEVTVWSLDNAGNVESATPYTIRVDKTGPEITGSTSPAPNAAGWNRSDPTVTFTCTDALSGIVSCTSPVTVTAQGALQPVVGTARDQATNTATTTVSVSLDRTPPTVTTGILGPDRTAFGWYNAPLTVTFGCADQSELSGVASCPADAAVGEGANQGRSGTATDVAGNATTTGVTGLNVDTTKPTISGGATTAPNGAGWYRGNVTVHWTCGDALSGIAACDSDSVVGGEGAALSATGSTTDKAGNDATASVGGLKIDRTDPATSASAPSGWQRGSVTVSLSATDNLSGVARTVYRVDAGSEQTGTSVSVTGNGVHIVTYRSEDAAGNVESAKTVTVSIDGIAPTISAALSPTPNPNGWLRTTGTVTFTCSDTGGSGLAIACPPAVTVNGTGSAGQVVTGSVSDNAGNTSTASVTVKVDPTAPTVTIGGVTAGASYTLGAVPAATCAATDTVSGLDGACSVTVSGGTSSGVGTFTATATAKDRAGNVADTVSVGYKVLYGYAGAFFLQPINDTAHQVGTATSVFKAGSTVPVKFQLLNAAGQPVQAAGAPIWEIPVKGGSTSTAVNETAFTLAGDSTSTFRWDAASQQYIYNWNTDKNQVGFYWQIGVKLDDTTIQYVKIGLR